MNNTAALALPSDNGIVWLSDEELAAATPDERRRYYSYLQRELHKRDPVKWGEDVLKERYWSKQRQILRSVQKNRKTAVASCHDTGKSFGAARAALWWISTGTPGRRFVVSTAPLGDLVKTILWREINQGHKKGDLIGRTNLTEWYIDDEIVAIGRKPNEYSPSSFVGVHAPEGVLVIYDEACGIPESLFVAGKSMTANPPSRELAIGNPDVPGSHFETLFAPESGWVQHHIGWEDTPNFTGEEVTEEVANSLISQEYVDDMAREYGVNSPFYISKVLGKFPKDRTDGMVPYSWIQACRVPQERDESMHPVELGIDVSAGGDETVVRARQGMKALQRWGWRYDDAMKSVDEIMDVIELTGAKKVKVDVIGVGFGIHGAVQRECEKRELDCEVIGVNVGEASTDPKRFKNLKAQIWWEVGRELSRERTWDLSEVEDQTIDEITEHRYFKDAGQRIQVEKKEDVIKRLKRSPDNADALLLAFYDPPASGLQLLGSA